MIKPLHWCWPWPALRESVENDWVPTLLRSLTTKLTKTTPFQVSHPSLSDIIFTCLIDGFYLDDLQRMSLQMEVYDDVEVESRPKKTIIL